jgi:DNA-binding response OmpR family regulator/HPt (histidine-containing phosphotransfer) domain-containing protein
MDFTKEEIEEFKNEAIEMLDQAEQSLLALEKGGDFKNHYNSIFRAFHSLKGGAGMLGLTHLQNHMHQVETQYQQYKGQDKLPENSIGYFLKAVDASRKILDGEEISFDYSMSESKAVTATPTDKNTSIQATSAADGDRIKIVCIDDEEAIGDILKEILNTNNFEAFVFNDPTLAVEEISKIKPEVVMTDFTMPRMNGYDVLRSIHKIDPDIPVVFLTGNISKDMLLKSLNAGVFSVLEKPFEEEQVMQTCHTASQKFRTTKLLNNTINFIYYQFSDLDQYLQEKGANEIREYMHLQLKNLLEAKRQLQKINN